MSTHLALLTPDRIVVGALVGVALAVGLVLSLQRPAVDRAAVLASLPWLVVGVTLDALGGVVEYPAMATRVVRAPWAYLLAATLGGLAWLLVTSVVEPESRAVRPHYVGTAGIGALLPTTAVLVVHAGVTAPERLVVWLVAPVVAAVVTYVVMIGLGLCMPNSGYFAGTTGAAVTFGLALDGIGTALAFGFGMAVVSPPGPLGALPGPIPPALIVAWALVWLRLVVAVGAIGVLSALERRRPAAAERGLELLTVVCVAVAANTYLLALGGGLV